MSKSSENSVALLVSVIKQLSSDSLQQREFERVQLQENLKKADETLSDLVDGNQESLKKTIQSFAVVSSRIQGCRKKVASLREKLSTCKTLLNCNRDDLRKHWQEGLEFSEILNLLDKVDKAIAVPDQLDRFMARKHYLHAAKLLVKTVSITETTLSHVDALRDLRIDLHSRTMKMHEILIEELNKQMYSDTGKSQMQKQSIDASPMLLVPGIKLHTRSSSRSLKPEAISDIQTEKFNEVVEDLQANPEDNVPLFINVIVEALEVLGKVPEAVESLKCRIKREIALAIHRATDLVANRVLEKGAVVTFEELAKRENPSLLIELLDVCFNKFRAIARNHQIVIDAVQRVKGRRREKDVGAELPDFVVYHLEAGKEDDASNIADTSEIQMYTKEEVWSEIEFSIQVLLGYYLDIQSRVTRQQSLSSFPNTESELGSFFVSKKKAKSSKYPLFRFEGSSSAIAMSSYLKDQGQDLVSSIPDDPYAESLLSSKPQLLCKPTASNITVLFIPVVTLIGEVEKMTSPKLGIQGALYHFVTDFVKKEFLHQISYAVTEKTAGATRGLDALKNLIDPATQNILRTDRPLLKATIAIINVVEELSTMMNQLPLYTNEFLEMILQILGGYLLSCTEAYKGLVLREEAEKPSRIFSASWVRDDDICRYLKSLPSWLNLQEERAKGKKLTDDEDIEAIRFRNAQQTDKLLGTLKKGAIEKGEVILDIGDLKSLVNLQESIDWFTKKLQEFVVKLSAKSTTVQVDDRESLENILAQIPPIPEETLRSLEHLVREFQELADTCLLVLHLEIQCHCLYYLIPATRQSTYVCTMDAVEVDPLVPQLTKDLRDIEEICSSSLAPFKRRYLFGGIGYLIASIIISSTSYIKKINRNGVKKMSQNIFTLQQELADIANPREPDLENAKHYIEMLFLTPDGLLNSLVEQGPVLKDEDYINAIELLCRSELPFDKNALEVRKRKLKEIISERQTNK